ncbi:MAG: hypothetical protein M1814_006808 [Vezdaea aestivalis]|nr:MAG: hypothetical protein M1814_006808 [Vezdaea aestivalis]
MTTTDPPSLSFPRAIFAKLSPRPYLLAHLSLSDHSTLPSRPCGRRPSQPRPATLHTGSLINAHGSAVVRTGDTAVVCGVRGELLDAQNVPTFRCTNDDNYNKQKPLTASEVRGLGLLVPNIELSTGCAPGHIPGQPPSSLAQSLSMRVLNLLHTSNLIDPEGLALRYQEPAIGDLDNTSMDVEGERVIKAFWVLYIDILFISLDGNSFDTAWAAALVALSATRLPKVEWDEDEEMLFCSSEKEDQIPLKLLCFPIPSTFVAIGAPDSSSQDRDRNRKDKAFHVQKWVLEDPDQFEESLCDETATIVVDSSKGSDSIDTMEVVRFEKKGGSQLVEQDIEAMIERASQRWQEWRGLVTAASQQA